MARILLTAGPTREAIDPVRDSGDQPPTRPTAAVPSAGKGRSRKEPDSGLEPQPLS